MEFLTHLMSGIVLSLSMIFGHSGHLPAAEPIASTTPVVTTHGTTKVSVTKPVAPVHIPVPTLVAATTSVVGGSTQASSTISVLTGYEWKSDAASPAFYTAILNIDSDDPDQEYEFDIWNGTEYTLLANVKAGEKVTFPDGVHRFRVLGIHLSLRICPFARVALWDMTFATKGKLNAIRNPITTDIPASGGACNS